MWHGSQGLSESVLKGTEDDGWVDDVDRQRDKAVCLAVLCKHISNMAAIKSW